MKFILQTAALLFLLFSGFFALANSQQDSLEKMLLNERIRTPYIDEYLRQLEENQTPDPSLINRLGWKWNTREELDVLGAEFEKNFQNPSDTARIRVRLDIREYNHRKHGKGLLLLGILYLDDAARKPLALFGRSFRKKNGEIEVWGDGLRIDHSYPETAKIVSPLLKYIDSIYRQINAKRERLVADWRGRYYWTMADYSFDPDYFFWIGEAVYTQIDTARQNFERFLHKNRILERELVIDGIHGPYPLGSVENLMSPRDFTKVKHPMRKVSLRILTDVGIVWAASDPLDVGMAFTLSDYTPKNGDKVIRSCSKLLEYNDYSMPAWRALRILK